MKGKFVCSILFTKPTSSNVAALVEVLQFVYRASWPSPFFFLAQHQTGDGIKNHKLYKKPLARTLLVRAQRRRKRQMREKTVCAAHRLASSANLRKCVTDSLLIRASASITSRSLPLPQFPAQMFVRFWVGTAFEVDLVSSPIAPFFLSLSRHALVLAELVISDEPRRTRTVADFRSLRYLNHLLFCFLYLLLHTHTHTQAEGEHSKRTSLSTLDACWCLVVVDDFFSAHSLYFGCTLHVLLLSRIFFSGSPKIHKALNR